MFLMASFTLKAQQYQFQNYSVNNGLGQSQVFTLLEDQKGYIWMGTRGGGLSRFDGVEFKSFGTKDGLPSNYLWAATESNNGDLWFGTDKGLVAYKSGEFVSQKGVFEGKAITALCSFENMLFVGSIAGLGVINEQGFREIEIEHKGAISVITVVNGKLYVGSDQGLAVSDIDTNFDFRICHEQLKGVKVRSLLATDSSIWIGTYGDGLYHYKSDSIVNLSDDFQLENARIYSISQSMDFIWIATQLKGITRIKKSDLSLDFLMEKHGLANNHVREILEDSWGNVWIGTSGGGVSKYVGQTFSYYSKNNGLQGSYIYSVSNDCENRIWVATSKNGLAIFDDNRVVEYQKPSSLPNAKIRCTLHSLDSLLWIGYDGQGVAMVDTDTVILFNTQNGLKSNYIRCLLEDGIGNIWVATAGGGISVISTNDSTWHVNHIGKEKSLPSDRINMLLLDRDNRVWFTTVTGGAGYIIDDSVEFVINDLNGLVDKEVNSITQGLNDRIWLGTAKAGLLSIEFTSDTFLLDTINLDDGLASEICYQLTCDGDGDIWVGSEKGIEELKIGEDGSVIGLQFFGYNEGFQGVETTKNAAFLASDGALWFGTIDGLSRYTGNQKQTISQLPKLELNRFVVNSVSREFNAQKMVLPFDSNIITIGYHSISQHKAQGHCLSA